MSDFYRIEYRRARRAHVCEEAACVIRPGDRYAYHSGLQEGFFFRAATCELCQGIRDEAWRAFDWYPEEAPYFGDLRTFLREEEGIQDVDAWYAERLRVARTAAAFQSAALAP